MMKNYFIIAFRNLVRHKTFSFINIFGLAVGLASALLLFTVIRYELSYNTDQPDYHSIYHVVTEDKTSDGLFYTPGIPFPALEALRLDFPQIKIGALMANYGSQVSVLNENKSGEAEKKFLEETGFFFCDPQFFQVFQYHWLVGSPEELRQPNVTVLTQSMAEKYFGNWENAIGKYLKLDNAITTKVVGILKDIPRNTDYPLAVISSYETVKANPGVYFYMDKWGATTSNFQIFMRLPANVSPDQINKSLVAFSKKNYPDMKRAKRTHFLQPLAAVHFDTRFESFGDHVISKTTLWTLGLIGLFIIIMACINFINLSTAQAVRRSKEIGIRKVLGSYRSQLFMQIIGETLMIVCASLLLALGLAYFFLPYIKSVAMIQEPLSIFKGETILFLSLVALVITFLSGIYPALILSGFNPALALKNKITSASVGGISLRRGLVITQFAISQVLIIGTIIAVSQMNFVRTADLGFNKEALLVITANTDSIAQSRQEAYKNKLLQTNGVKSVTFSSDLPSSQNNSATNFTFDHKPAPDFSLYLKYGDEDFFSTFQLQLLAGRGYSKSDTVNEVVVNETLMKKLGIQNANTILGKDIQYGSGGNNWKKIVGVVKDFKTNTLKEDIKPLAIAENRSNYYLTTVKLNSTNILKTRAAVETAWNQFYPEYAFTSNFLEENIAEFYKQDEQLSLLYKIFAGIAILISCMGLYGLVSFMAAQKTKEIGVRKVLGASVKNIIFLFSKEFTILILIGSLLAIPVAYYMMNSWLQSFIFRIKMEAWIFILAIIISIFIAWLAVGYKSIKAAIVNPVKSLRSE